MTAAPVFVEVFGPVFVDAAEEFGDGNFMDVEGGHISGDVFFGVGHFDEYAYLLQEEKYVAGEFGRNFVFFGQFVGGVGVLASLETFDDERGHEHGEKVFETAADVP